MTYKIDKDIPLEKHGGVGQMKTKYPWKYMSVGDSVGFSSLKEFRSASVSVYNYTRANPNKQFRCRSKKLRVWRVI